MNIKNVIIFLAVVPLFGCAMEMTKKQFNEAWKTETQQMSYLQYQKGIAEGCKSLGEQEVKSMGLTVNQDVSIAAGRVDKKVREVKGTHYHITDHDWVLDAFGGTILHVYFDVVNCPK